MICRKCCESFDVENVKKFLRKMGPKCNTCDSVNIVARLSPSQLTCLTCIMEFHMEVMDDAIIPKFMRKYSGNMHERYLRKYSDGIRT